MIRRNPIATLAALALAASLAGVTARPAVAQHYDGCFVGGQQVADSMCNPGSSGGGGGPTMNSAAMGAAGSLGFAIGGALGSMLRDALTAPPADTGSDEDAAAAAADQATALQNAHANFLRQQQQRQAVQQQQQQQFQANQQDLLGQIRSIGGDDSGDAGSGDSPVVDLDGNGGKAASLQPRQLDMSGDSGAVDLTGAGTATLDPRRVTGNTNGNTAKSAFQPAKNEDMQYLLPKPTALQLADDADMQYLFPDQPSLWPGPKNPDARLLNPLRQRAEYLKFLSAEETQFPGKRAEIEKLRQELDSDAERRKALADEGAKIARDYNATVAAADRDLNTKLTKVLDADDRTYGAASHQALFDKSHHDAALADTLRQQTRPLLDARAQTVDHAQANAMLSMYDAFDRINPGLPR